MKSLARWWKQATCLHWFDLPTVHEYSIATGPIICLQQKQWRVTDETRVCSRCGLTDVRRIGEPVFEGWD